MPTIPSTTKQPSDTTTTAITKTPVKRILVTGIITSIIAAAVLIILFAVQNTSHHFDTATKRSSHIQQMFPPLNTSILRQDNVGVVASPTWYCNLTIDGIRIPERQLSGAKELGQCFFRPGPNKIIEELQPGPHRASVQVFPLTDPRSTSNFNWTFSVT